MTELSREDIHSLLDYLENWEELALGAYSAYGEVAEHDDYYAEDRKELRRLQSILKEMIR
jgi:hypothetical protein